MLYLSGFGLSVVFQRSRRKHIILFLIMAFILLFLSFNFPLVDSANEGLYFSGYISHDPIFINNDDDFLIYGFPGNGTLLNPYIIENYHIFGIEEDGGYGISIRNTSKIYTIRNCLITEGFYGITIHSKNSDSILIENNFFFNPQRSGINIDKSKNLILRNNTCFSATNGIRVYDSINCSVLENDCTENSNGIVVYGISNSSIRDNYCFENRYGIYVINSERISLLRNNCTKNKNYGIELKESKNLLVKDNFCKRNAERGIYLSSGLEDINIANNTCVRNTYGGITIFSFNNITLEYNNLFENGFVVYDSKGVDNLKMRGNYVNNKLVGFFTNIGEEVFINEDFGQLFLINCISVLIKNLEISRVNTAIYLKNCEDITIQKCKVMDCQTNSISVLNSRNIIIKDNFLWSNYNCESIVLRSCKQTIIRNNTCKGIPKSAGPEGIQLYSSYKITIERNWIFKNDHGIFFIDSSNCTIRYNRIENNSDYGVYLRENSHNNTIHHNSFIGNNYDEGSQALDKGENNTWFDPLTKEGNYWSDYDGDGNYSIDSSAKSKDPYPLNEDLEKIHETNFPIVTISICLLVILNEQRKKNKKGK